MEEYLPHRLENKCNFDIKITERKVMKIIVVVVVLVVVYAKKVMSKLRKSKLKKRSKCKLIKKYKIQIIIDKL